MSVTDDTTIETLPFNSTLSGCHLENLPSMKPLKDYGKRVMRTAEFGGEKREHQAGEES